MYHHNEENKIPNHFVQNLKGIQADNLLGFLAILGLLRSLECIKPDWQPRVYWIGSPLSANLLTTESITKREIVETCNDGIKLLGAKYEIFENIKDLNFKKHDFRNFAWNSRMNRDDSQVVSTLASDSVTKKNSDDIKPTPLCTMFGSGHQHFLDRLKKVPGNGNSNDIHSALFDVWKYKDNTPSFRWDPIEHRSYAHQYGNPSVSSNKIGTVHGANRLAAIGFGILSSAPKTRDLATPGVSILNHKTVFSWPLPSVPTSLSGYLALMVHPKLLNEKQSSELTLYGVAAVARAHRFQSDRFFNFSRAQIQHLS